MVCFLVFLLPWKQNEDETSREEEGGVVTVHGKMNAVNSTERLEKGCNFLERNQIFGIKSTPYTP